MASLPMRVAIGSDHAGLLLRGVVRQALAAHGVAVDDLGPLEAASVDYPDYAAKVCAEVTAGRADLGVLVCGTGIGMSIAANKHHGIRAALCRTELEARLGRQHNDANVLCLGERVTGPGLAEAIVAAFLSAAFEGGRHARRVDKLKALDG